MLQNETGEDILHEMFSSFSCNKNKEVETFLSDKAIMSAKQKQSITYLVMSKTTGAIVGYFTLTIKPITIVQDIFDGFSAKLRNKIRRNAKYDPNTNSFALSSYLIAQFGKNDNVNEISGADLMEISLNKIQQIQYMVGGNIAFVEATPHPKLIQFYEDRGFRQFAVTAVNNEHIEETTLLQLLVML